MIVTVNHTCADFDSYRAARVKSLFNVESGCNFNHVAELPIEDFDWKIGIIVGPSGSGKTSIGKLLWGEAALYDLYAGWEPNKPIVDCITPDGEFNQVTAMLSSVGLGDVPAWSTTMPGTPPGIATTPRLLLLLSTTCRCSML